MRVRNFNVAREFFVVVADLNRLAAKGKERGGSFEDKYEAA